MRATIHQPYFIPWLGYFSKLAFSDVFVVLDNAQFRKRYFYDRTRIVNMHGEIRWLSLPVGENYKKTCDEVFVKTTDYSYPDSLLKTLGLSYAKSRHYDSEWEVLQNAITRPLNESRNLVEINVEIISNIAFLLDLPVPKIIYSSQIISNKYENPTDRIINICDLLGVDSVIIGGGKGLTLHDWHRVSESGVNVYLQDYLAVHPNYEQSRRKHSGFQAGLSIVDPILNVGRKTTKSYLLDSRYKPILFR